MKPTPTKWRYGARISRSGKWIWPRSCYEYDFEKAKAAALRTFRFSTTVGVEPAPPAPALGERWVHEANKGWRKAGAGEDMQAAIAAAAAPPSEPVAHRLPYRDD